MGDLDWTLKVGGMDRIAHVHVPKGYDPTKAVPVVLNFPRLTSNGQRAEPARAHDRQADAASFIAVHPEGTGSTPSWNAGACCGDAAANAVDDSAFVGKIIDELESKLCVDSHRIFATGMSNGGFLSHRLASSSPRASLPSRLSPGCSPSRRATPPADVRLPVPRHTRSARPLRRQPLHGLPLRAPDDVRLGRPAPAAPVTPRETSKKG